MSDQPDELVRRREQLEEELARVVDELAADDVPPAAGDPVESAPQSVTVKSPGKVK